jgi:threonine dehydratase
MSAETLERIRAAEQQEERYDADQVAIEVLKRIPAAQEAVGAMCVRTLLSEQSSRITPELRVFTKEEFRQPVKSFKLRGAAAAIAEYLNDHPGANYVVTASAGNHLQGVAYAARQHGLKAIGHTARSISEVKAERASSLGATLDSTHSTLENALTAASLAGDAFIHPFDSYAVMAGAGTLLTETLDDLREQGINLQQGNVVIAVPVGGGGLLAGMAVSLYEQQCDGYVGQGIQLVGVQMEGCDAAYRVKNGAPADTVFNTEELDQSCDGTAVTRPGDKTRAILEDPRFVSDIVTVTKAEVGGAMQGIHTRLRVMAEPAGALAWALTDKLRAHYNSSHQSDQLVLVNILSGANVTDETWDHFYDEYRGFNALAERASEGNGYKYGSQPLLKSPTRQRPIPIIKPTTPYLKMVLGSSQFHN